MAKKISINPITRLEGHGKIEIFLDDEGNVGDVFWQVVELRGFETFCLGRPAEEMPRITSNICGVCPTAHNMAATRALDDLYSVKPTPTASLIRQLHYNAFIVEDHYIHFYFLSAPDFIVGTNAGPAVRNILGLIEQVGADIGGRVIDIRKRCREIIRLISSKPAHPESGLPGGVGRGISEDERKWIKQTADDTLEFAQFTLKLFKDLVLGNEKHLALIQDDAYMLNTYYMGMVDDNNRAVMLDGRLRVVGPGGVEYTSFEPADYINHIGEWVEPWTYVRLTYLKQLGWQGLKDGPQSSLYRVGPLARLNVAQGMATPLAQREYEFMYQTLGSRPSHHTLAFHWARLIEALQAAEEMKRIAGDPILTSKDIRNMDLHLKQEGVGCVEAARGTLIHHYQTDERGLLAKVNLIVATQQNAAPICLSVKKAAQSFINNGEVKEGLLNMVEMAFRAYDPCLACATHALPGHYPLAVNIRSSQGSLLQTIKN